MSGVPDLIGLAWPRHTERLTLRPITVADADDAARYRSDLEVTRYLSHGVLTREQVVRRHEERVRRMQPGAPDPMLGLAILDADRLVGDCMLDLRPASGADAYLAPDGVRVGWIGYALAPEAQGHGYATEIARELVAIAAELRLPRLFAQARPANEASHRVLLKAGFQRVSELDTADSLLFTRETGPTT